MLVLAVEHEVVGVLGLVELPDLGEDPELPEHPLHPERARLVGHDRHDPLADRRVANERVEDADERHRRRVLALAAALEHGVERRRGRQRIGVVVTRRQAASERGATLEEVAKLRAVLRRAVEEGARRLLVGQREAEAIADRKARLVVHRLLLVGDVPSLAGLAHPEALDRLGEDHRGPPGRLHRRGVGRVDLLRVVTAAAKLPDLLVGPVLDHRARLGVLAEEVLAHVGAVLRLEGLVLAVDRLLHPEVEPPLGVGLEQRIPARAPDHLEDVPACAREVGLELLDDLAVAAHRPVEALQVAVDHEDEVVELLAAGKRDRAHRLRLVHLAVAHECPDLAVAGIDECRERRGTS